MMKGENDSSLSNSLAVKARFLLVEMSNPWLKLYTPWLARILEGVC